MAEGDKALRKRGRSDTPANADAPAEPRGESVEQLRARLAAARAEIGLRSSPITALRLAFLWLFDTILWCFLGVLRSPFTWLLLVPGVGAWFAAKYSLAPHLFSPPKCGEVEAGILWQVELALKESAWWIVLGILSSVGFGTGLHSGIMFLFPHVMQVVAAAEGCGTTTGLVTWYQHPCKLDCHTTSGPKDGSTVTVFRLWALVTVQCMLWGLGTGIGELPPYLVSKAARLAGHKDSDFHAELEEARGRTDLFSRMKIWTIEFTEKHGFLGVFLLASWPNAAFDMCGMCCGYVLMPFWTFFIATCMGKGMVKVNGQALAFVNLFGSRAFQVVLGVVDNINSGILSVTGQDLGLHGLLDRGRSTLIRKFELESRFAPEKLFVGKKSLNLDAIQKAYAKQDDSLTIAHRVLKEWDTNHDGKLTLEELSHAASRTDGKISLSSLDPGTGTSILKMLWELFIVSLVLFFLYSVIDQAARTKQQELDEKEIERYEREHARRE